jgi:hypothetical protein
VYLEKNLALAAIALVFLLGAAFQSSNSVPGQLAAIQSQLSDLKAQVASLANKGPRKFYLTKTFHNGAEALSACAAGYHMASLWEIHEPSNLRYDTELGLTREDSGFGPPGGSAGWIPTGFDASSGAVFPGTGNCKTWTSASTPDFGTVVALPIEWGVPPNGEPLRVVDPWRAPFASSSLP